MIKNKYGQIIFGTNTFHTDNIIPEIIIGDKIGINFKFKANLGEGNYSISVAFHQYDTHIAKNYNWIDRIYMFKVLNKKYPSFIGTNFINVAVSSQIISSP
jgi:lipopolysaccharide transport system ATP-binding protein